MMQTNQDRAKNQKEDEDSIGSDDAQETTDELLFSPSKDDQTPESDATGAFGGMETTVTVGAVDTTRFPWKLHRMLTEIEKGGLDLEQIVSWQPHGRCFCIRDKRAFIDTVMPKYFYQLKYVSFQRQLNLYGFKKVYGQGPDKGAYYHEMFLRGLTEMAGSIQRVKAVKGGGSSRKAKSEDQPEIDFYAMPALDEKAELSLEARAKALQEAANSPAKSKKAGKKRRTSSKKAIAQLKNENTPTVDEAETADLEPTPLPTSFPASPSISQISAAETIGDLLAPIQGSTKNQLTSPTLAAASSEMQHIQELQLQLQQQSQHVFQQQGMASNLGNSASLGMARFGGPGDDQVMSSLMNPDPSQQSAPMAGGVGLWDMEPTPLKPGAVLGRQERKLAAGLQQSAEYLRNQQQLHQLFQQQQDQSNIQHLQEQQQQQQLLLREQLFEQQREQLLPSMNATEQSSVFFQQQQRLMQQLNQQQMMPQLQQQQQMQQQQQQQQFPNQRNTGNQWPG